MANDVSILEMIIPYSQFKCKEDSLDTLVSVEEPSTCKYLLHVSTPHLCKHPSLRQVPEKTSLPIVCNPVLSDSDYKDYVEYQKRLTEQRDKEEDTQLERKSSFNLCLIVINCLWL